MANLSAIHNTCPPPPEFSCSVVQHTSVFCHKNPKSLQLCHFIIIFLPLSTPSFPSSISHPFPSPLLPIFSSSLSTYIHPPPPSPSLQVIGQAGQVWYPDSAFKTAQTVMDLNREGLPLFIFANWRGFSGGMRGGLLSGGQGGFVSSEGTMGEQGKGGSPAKGVLCVCGGGSGLYLGGMQYVHILTYLTLSLLN